MADKYFEDQFEDEEVLFVFRKHPIVMRRGLIFGLLCLLLGVVPSLFDPQNAVKLYLIGLACGAVVGLLVMLPGWISWWFSVFIVTNQRLIQITQKGMFHRSVVDMRLNQIQMINYEVSGFQETILGFGTIMMQTYVGDLVIHEIHHPAKIQKKLLEIMREQGITPVSSPSADDAAQGRIPEEETIDDEA